MRVERVAKPRCTFFEKSTSLDSESRPAANSKNQGHAKEGGADKQTARK